MTLSVTGALRDGLGRTFERNGVQLIAVFFTVRLATAVADDTFRRTTREPAVPVGDLPGGSVFAEALAEPAPFALDVGVVEAVLLVGLVALAAEAARIVAVRTMVSDRVDAIPAEFVRRNVGLATINGFVGGAIVLTLSALGLAVLIAPGVFLAVSLFFVRQEIAVRDVNFVEAMRGSWSLAAGHRLELLALATVLVAAELVSVLPGAAVASVDPTSGAVIGAAVQAPVLVFGVASTCRAYDQLRTPPPAEEEDAYAGALGPDDLPEPDRDGW